MNEALPPLPERHLTLHGYDGSPLALYTAEQMQAYARAGLEAQAEPAGWKLVPVEPTRVMLAACACSTTKGIDFRDAQRIYAAMLAAAPQQPPQER